MRIFKTRLFARYARRERIADRSLRDAIHRAERGLVDADLRGGLIKQRVAREGHGRSGGYRMLIAFRSQSRAVFLFGFAKNEMDNIDVNELASLHEIAAAWLAADDEQIDRAIRDKLLLEVPNVE